MHEHANRVARRESKFAVEVGIDAGHDLEQRRLASAVGAEHADLGAVHERQCDVFDEIPIGWNELPDLVHCHDVISHRQKA